MSRTAVAAPSAQVTPVAQGFTRWRAALARRCAVLMGLALLGGTLPAWQGAAPGAWIAWLLDMAVHWQWLYAGLGTVAGLLWLGLAQPPARRWAGTGLLALAVLMGLNLRVFVLPALPSAPPTSAAEQGGSVRLLSFNVHLDNEPPPAMLDWLLAQQADVLALLEVTPAMQPLLQTLAARYPHQALLPRQDPFGMAVFSRYPLQGAHFADVESASATPRLRATVLASGGSFELHVLHPMPPISAQALGQRDALLQRMATQPAATHGQVLMGDLNTSAWAAGLRDLGRAGWARATSLAPTYALLRSLPIDHILATRAHWRVVATGQGPWLGSDHRPVWAVLQPMRPVAAATAARDRRFHYDDPA